MLSDTRDATAPVAVSASSRRTFPTVDEHVHVRVSDSVGGPDRTVGATRRRETVEPT